MRTGISSPVMIRLYCLLTSSSWIMLVSVP